ncbi:MAG TPA: hypothetical protein DHV28_10695 [Ignavibacteriales bacterium]|nr:hypothetical protein [Ignavibacteriales bacterium]
MKSKSIFLLFWIVLIVSSFIPSYGQDLKRLLLMDDNPEKETTDYKNRVSTDNGYVQSLYYLDSFIKKTKDNFYDDIKFWISTEWGLKVEQEKVLKQYDLKGNDLTSPEIENCPSLKLNDLFRLNGIYYSGNKQFCDNDTLAVEHPMTLILVIQQTDGLQKEALLDTKHKKEHSILFDDESVDPVPLSVEIGKKTVIGNIGITKSFLYFEFNGDSSKVFNNGVTMFAGNINSGELNGIRIGTLKNLQKDYYFSGYIFEIGIIGKILAPEQRMILTNLIKEHYSIN